MQRRHDIDALRALAFALLILYHWGMLYVLDWDFHLKSAYQAEWLQFAMVFVNRWRMDLIFMISGIAIGLYQPAREPGRFAWMRSWRLLLPLVFGCLVVIPVQPYVQGVANGAVEPGYLHFLGDYFGGKSWPADAFTGWEHGFTWNHLWYLVYLWVYTMLLTALLPLLESRVGKGLQGLLTRRRGLALLVLPAIWFFAGLTWLEPRFPKTHALVGDWFLHAQYFSVFVCGYAIARDEGMWCELLRLRWKALAVALAAASVHLLLKAAGKYLTADQVPAGVPDFVWSVINDASYALYLWTAMLAILGWGHALLNRPFRWLPWANEAVYPWYVLHQSLLLLVAYWLLPLHLGPVLEPLLVLSGTVAGCWALHGFVIRRSRWLRPSFGLKGIAHRRNEETGTGAMPVPLVDR